MGRPSAGGARAPALLDKLSTSALAAYGLRKLSNAYTGNAIRVRRSSDNTEQDIGFVGPDLDIASLLSFVGAANGFVTTCYDQSGNGRNITQTTAANQRGVVAAGVLRVSNGRPTMLGSSAAQFLTTPANATWLANVASYTINAVAALADTAGADFLLGLSDGTATTGLEWFVNTGNQVWVTDTTTFAIYDVAVSAALAAWIITKNGASGSELFANGISQEAQLSPTGTLNGNGPLYVGGRYSGDSAFQGSLSEIMIFGDVLSSDDCAALANDQASYFGIS
jgi:trimeric autotransporter adhesin